VHFCAASRTVDRVDESGGVAGRAYSSVLVVISVYESQLTRDSSLFVQMAILETPRLTLRPFREEDVDLLSGLMANTDFMRFSLGPKTREQTAAFLETVIGWNRAGLPSPFAVVIRSNGVLVGYCGFLHQEVDGEKEIEIGYRLHPDYWNKGIATEAARAVRDHAFRDLKLLRVVSLIHPENSPSQRVAEKLGMSLEKQTIYRGSLTNVFFLSRARWGKENAA
jgi:ribosomal-protein-alanine N-acetyltransferase